MSKVLNFELSKRLNDLWLLDDIETEYVIEIWTVIVWEYKYAIDKKDCFCVSWYYKTLTLEEAIEFLPFIEKSALEIKKHQKYYSIWYPLISQKINFVHWNTLLITIERLIEYLLDNNLLTK